MERAQRENTAKSNAVLDSLNRLNIPNQDISTASFEIQPQYDYIEGRQVLGATELVIFYP